MEEKIRNFYKNNRLDLIDCEKDYVNSFVDYEKYDLLNELSEKVPVSNGSRYYKKYDIIEGENLIVSKDSLNGGIDSAEIKRFPPYRPPRR